MTLESEDISDLIQPLGSENTGRWMNSVLDRILPDLKSSLDAEYGRERDEMESEHKSRLQETATYFPVVYVRRYRRRCHASTFGCSNAVAHLLAIPTNAINVLLNEKSLTKIS